MGDEQGALVSPDLFIAAAERYGITPRIDRWVVETAFRWLVSDTDERERLAHAVEAYSGMPQLFFTFTMMSAADCWPRVSPPAACPASSAAIIPARMS